MKSTSTYLGDEQDIFDELKYDITITESGSKIYRNKEGKLHRDEGPAIIYKDSTQMWYQNDMLHREDGPSMICPGGQVNYFLNDICYEKEEYDRELRTRSI
jgi:hypothetical protein